LTGGWSTGRKGIKYAFYHCYTKGCSLSVKKHEIEHRFKEYLETYHPNEDVFNLFEAIILDVQKTKQSSQIKNQSDLAPENCTSLCDRILVTERGSKWQGKDTNQKKLS
jgi:hypothetical protein